MRKNNSGNHRNAKRNTGHQPVRLRGLSVEVDRFRNFEAAMNKWCRKVQDDGRLDVVRERQHFEKPTQARRRKRQIAILKEKYRRLNSEPNANSRA